MKILFDHTLLSIGAVPVASKAWQEIVKWSAQYPPANKVWCNDKAPRPLHWVCTREWGHDGPHVGHIGLNAYVVWTDVCREVEHEE